MARFTLAKKEKIQHGWKTELLEVAREKHGHFEPTEVTYAEFIEQIVAHYLSEIYAPYAEAQKSNATIQI